MIFAPITARSVVELCILQGIFPQLRFNIKTEILIAKKKDQSSYDFLIKYWITITITRIRVKRRENIMRPRNPIPHLKEFGFCSKNVLKL